MRLAACQEYVETIAPHMMLSGRQYAREAATLGETGASVSIWRCGEGEVYGEGYRPWLRRART